MNRASRYWLKFKRLEQAIDRIRDIHRAREDYEALICPICRTAAPCPTMQALDDLDPRD